MKLMTFSPSKSYKSSTTVIEASVRLNILEKILQVLSALFAGLEKI